MTEVRFATDGDREAIHTLLARADLPTADLDAAQPFFIVAQDGSALVGAAALERYGTTALVRSVVVAAGARNRGLGHLLIQELEKQARAEGLVQLVLLTQTAKAFFEREGYVVIDRASAPPAVQASAEFRLLCPQSATCMLKPLQSCSFHGG